MIHLIDTSVWIDYLNGAHRPPRYAMRHLVDESPETLAICPPIRMELRMGANDLAVDPDDVDSAADIFRVVRSSGHRVRSSIGCLIAAVAERHRARLVHADVDVARIAAVVPSLDALDVRTGEGEGGAP